jgi:hypothetical protein
MSQIPGKVEECSRLKETKQTGQVNATNDPRLRSGSGVRPVYQMPSEQIIEPEN